MIFMNEDLSGDWALSTVECSNSCWSQGCCPFHPPGPTSIANSLRFLVVLAEISNSCQSPTPDFSLHIWDSNNVIWDPRPNYRAFFKDYLWNRFLRNFWLTLRLVAGNIFRLDSWHFRVPLRKICLWWALTKHCTRPGRWPLFYSLSGRLLVTSVFSSKFRFCLDFSTGSWCWSSKAALKQIYIHLGLVSLELFVGVGRNQVDVLLNLQPFLSHFFIIVAALPFLNTLQHVLVLLNDLNKFPLPQWFIQCLLHCWWWLSLTQKLLDVT